MRSCISARRVQLVLGTKLHNFCKHSIWLKEALLVKAYEKGVANFHRLEEGTRFI